MWLIGRPSFSDPNNGSGRELMTTHVSQIERPITRSRHRVASPNVPLNGIRDGKLFLRGWRGRCERRLIGKHIVGYHTPLQAKGRAIGRTRSANDNVVARRPARSSSGVCEHCASAACCRRTDDIELPAGQELGVSFGSGGQGVDRCIRDLVISDVRLWPREPDGRVVDVVIRNGRIVIPRRT